MLNVFSKFKFQDSCELCDVLYNAWLLYRVPTFRHEKFVRWLETQSDGAFGKLHYNSQWLLDFTVTRIGETGKKDL